MKRHLVAVVMLVLIYALTLGSFDLWDLALGAMFAIGSLFLFRGFLFPVTSSVQSSSTPPLLSRFASAPHYALAVLIDVIRGTIQVIKIVVRIEPLRAPGIVRIPIGERSRTGVVVSGLATTISPGSLLVDIDWETGFLLVHVIDASDPDAIRAAHEQMYQRFQRRVFP